MTIQNPIFGLFIEYFLMQFLKNLIKIRNNTFKAFTIKNAFEKLRIWLVNLKIYIKQLKTFNLKFFNLTND